MRRDGHCPICGEDYGRVEEDQVDGIPVRRYWHTDLVNATSYCIERADGKSERIRQGQLANG